MTSGPSGKYYSDGGIELFKEDMEVNVDRVYANLRLLDSKDKDFARQLCEFYGEKGYLSNAQLSYMVKFWHTINDQS